MKFCLGTVQFGQTYGIKGNIQASVGECVRILEHAICDRGIDSLDTAPGYGNAQQVIGEFFKRNPSCKKNVNVTSKIPSSVNITVDKIKSIVDDSLRVMGIDVLDGLLLHSEDDIQNDEIIGLLTSLLQEGLIRHFGVSVYSPEIALYATTINELDYIQVPYNVLDKRLEDVGFFKIAQENAKTVFARSVFLQGLLLMNEPPVPSAIPYVKKFQEIAKSYGLTAEEACINYVNGNTAIDYLVMGIDFLSEIDDNLLALAKPCNEDLHREIRNQILCSDEEILIPSLWRRN